MAGGASCAARLRRLDESVEIVIFDRGPYVAFANCGLPYYVGDVISDEQTLLVASPELFRDRFNIEVHTNTDVVGIDRAARTIAVRDLHTGDTRTERYDALVLSPGATSIRPPLPGVDLPGIFAVRNIPDSRHIRSWIADHRASRAVVVVGGGFIGLEMVENLIHRGLTVTVVERLPQLMPPLDPEVAVPLTEHLIAKGVQVHLGDGLARIDIDVREPDEFATGHVPKAINLPLSQMRDRYAELPTEREIWTCCGVGQRAYFATRFLMQHGYRSRNLSGGYTTYQAFRAVGRNR